MEYLSQAMLSPWLGMPLWVWLAFIGVVLLLLVFDLGVLHRNTHEISVTESLWMSALYIGLGLLWSVAVWWIYATYADAGAVDEQIASQTTDAARAWTAVKLYITGYLVEKTLAMDNVFVISMIFTYFAVPRLYQHRVLFWGILGVIVLRAIMIGLGATLVVKFSWIMLIFAAILVLTGIKMIMVIDQKPDIANNPVLKFMRRHMRVTNELHGQHFFVRLPDPGSGKVVTWATPLFLCLVLVEVADLIFAIDSVPAIFAITPDAFIVYTSNIFAILGLRALYFALAAMVHRFYYLKYALALVLIFIGGKIVVGDFLFDGKVPAEISLGVTAVLIAGGIAYSLWKTRGGGEAPTPTVHTAAPAHEPGLKVGDIMTHAFVSVGPNASIGEAASLMASSGVSGLLVMDEGKRPVGVITEGDLIRREALGHAPHTSLWRTLFTNDRTLARAFAKAYGRRVAEVMSRDIFSVTPDTSVSQAAALLYQRDIKRLPVLRGNAVIGMLSRGDIVRALGRLGTDLQTHDASDAQIADAVAAGISRAPWISPQQVQYSVKQGVVEVSGVVTSDDQRLALHALVEGIAGVRGMSDRLRVTSALAA